MPSLRELMAHKDCSGKPTTTGLKLSDPSAPEPGESQPLPPQAEEQGRELQRTTVNGEDIPIVYPSENASPDEKLWWQARHSLQQDLVIWLEPGSDYAWLAVEPPNRITAPLVLLQRLPLANNPEPGNPF
jgi:hypothetical protein